MTKNIVMYIHYVYIYKQNDTIFVLNKLHEEKNCDTIYTIFMSIEQH